MGEAHGNSDTDPDTLDPKFGALLRRAACVSGIAPALPYAGLLPGSKVLEGRLHILKRLGEGGMGMVYQAYDERRRGPVAVKTLSRLDASNVYRLKNEFRSLSHVTHDNLCRLHELFSADGWFFTMEFIDGVHFDRWVCPDGRLDETRLRAALPQLRDAVQAVHHAGKLHRDLKPSNVLVTAEGRVVVLDFGLAVDSDPGGIGQTVLGESVSGTPAYMSPEQAAGAVATQASDYYAFGVMLFEALTRRLPFAGRVGEVLSAKQQTPAPAVRSLCPGAPSDLADLCDALLALEPATRPQAASLERALGLRVASKVPDPGSARTPGERELLVGREHELAALRDAYEATLALRPVVLFVSGESGMGKSALVNHFLDDLRASSDAVVFRGRCYERESVPFKAFDSVVDDISRYLRKLSYAEAAELMPREVFALVRLFPVLERVEAVIRAPSKDIPDPQELQQRAFAAFAELIGRIRDRRPVVLYVDDLQWSCRDSTVFMDYLLSLPEPNPILLIVSHRSEGAEADVHLSQLVHAAARHPRIDRRHMRVGQLPCEAAQLLARCMLGEEAREAAATIAQEAQGSPFFVGELVRQAQAGGAGASALSLQQAVLLHVQRLDVAARALLDALAVAGRPLPVALALDASGANHEALDVLLSERLLRAGRAGGTRTLECYHDKIRECVSGALSAEALRALHRCLAEQLSQHALSDPEHLALHYHGAGEHALAAVHYERAGEASAAALAFEYAARQYEQALALRPAAQPSHALQVKLAAVLAAAGRSYESAQLYRTIVARAPEEQALDLRREAARLFMVSGYADAGRVLLGEVLGAIHLSLPRTRRSAIAAALWSRARLKLRGLGFRAESEATVSKEHERQLGALWTVVQGAIGTDPFLMVEMSARYARLALDSGSHGHAARALATESYLVSFDGVDSRAHALELVRQATALAEPLSDASVLGFVRQVHGGVLVDLGAYTEGRAALAGALSWLQERCTGVSFELSAVRIYDQIAAHHLGAFAEIAESSPGLMEDALRRGDMWFATMFGTGFAVPAWLAARDLTEARVRYREVKQRYQVQTSYQWPDFFILLAEQSLALYEGSAQRALALAAEQQRGLEQAQLMRLHMARGCLLSARAGCALAALREKKTVGSAERALLKRDLRDLRATRVLNAGAWADALEAGLLLAEQDGERASARLRSAIVGFDQAGLAMHGAAARRRLGQLLRGSEGAELIARSDATMASQGVRELDATTEMLTPGCRP